MVDHSIESDVIDPMVWSVVLFYIIIIIIIEPHVLGLLFWLSMVLIHDFRKGLPVKGKGDHLARHL